ncbi:NAD(P)/FAD-dependent oxidoreductase [Nesterenkonia lutea]|uniref:3-phenylpropionate/trans-cinnamate dioxygenase ferredoxin reductase subunit n=1 Tax=Nesterenkonia lutea TaxID=272919 RepID=A0ABR9JH02_9MICC|nr:FAD-dependent oxidoreductase [Nesterenkonia lutea]MBE1525116.1 3-phenylpropionate/trans-cinnamate dioxygenase ferredoxin reductase subunit [Nesterenkonia lutea]
MGVVIIGGGQAGLQVADSLRSGGYEEPIAVISEEHGLPYQRPPLSKDYLTPGADPVPLPLRGETFFTEKNIDLRQGTTALAVDRSARTVALDDGTELTYDHLVFATGARNRRLSCTGADLDGVFGLKTLVDAQRLHRELAAAQDVVVVGAGFIGLEFAAAARAHGCGVTVLEFAAQPMGRAVSEETGAWFTSAHAELGVRLRLGEGIEHFESDERGRVRAAVSTIGSRYPADLVVVGIGVVANDALAAAAELKTENGIVVDASLRTSDPAVLAVGDCANFPNVHSGTRTRLESVQNATDQGKHAARTILGETTDYTHLPWFWSTQGSFRLQIAGLSSKDDWTVATGDPGAGKFSVLSFRGGQLAAVESVNSPADHMSARKLLGGGLGPTPDEAAAPGFSLKSYARQAASKPSGG